MKLSAVLLAGGESRRMGQDKATLLFNGQPLWCHQIDLLQSLAPLEILISARTDPPWRPGETLFVADRSPSHGPLSGLTAAMVRMRGTHLLALAVDMPLMTLHRLRAMCRLITADCGVVSKIGSRAEPLAAIYPRESLPHLSTALDAAAADFSLQRVTEKLVRLGLLAVIPVSKKEEALYRNFNAPGDMAKLETIKI